MADRLVGNFPRARPQNPKQYLSAIAATLAQYPAAIAEQCADPRQGLARTFRYEVPNVVDVIEWCDHRLQAYRGMSLPPDVPALPPPENPEMAAKVLGFLKGLGDRLRMAPDPLRAAHQARAAELDGQRRTITRRPLPRVPTNDELAAMYRKPAEATE